MREKVLRYIRERGLMRAGDRVAVAVSGGADSVALLRVLVELRPDLGIVLAVAHFNHQLRGAAAEADEAFVADLARQLGLEFFCGRGNVREHAAINKLGVEAAARELRLAFFAKVPAEQSFQSVATAHTLDDQAETVLLKLLRGAGTRGLAGIYPEIAALPGARIIRPMLGVTHDEVERYLTSLGQPWREDESNLDRRFTRNRVRHELLPLLEREYNPNIRQVLSDAAEVSRAEEQCWDNWVTRETEARMATPRQFHLAGFNELPLALQRRLLRRFAESHELTLDFEHIEKLRRCVGGDLSQTDLPGGWKAARQGECLALEAPASAPEPIAEYEYTLRIPGEVYIAEIGLTLRAVMVPEASVADDGAIGGLLATKSLRPLLTVRNWHPGDRFWPLHSRSQEKLKRLFSEKHIPAEQRSAWPLALSGKEIVWVRGFPVARSHAWSGKGEGLRLELF